VLEKKKNLVRFIFELPTYITINRRIRRSGWKLT